jgi:hypothetical protein
MKPIKKVMVSTVFVLAMATLPALADGGGMPPIKTTTRKPPITQVTVYGITVSR